MLIILCWGHGSEGVDDGGSRWKCRGEEGTGRERERKQSVALMAAADPSGIHRGSDVKVRKDRKKERKREGDRRGGSNENAGFLCGPREWGGSR